MRDAISNAILQLNTLIGGGLEPVRISITLALTFVIALLIFLVYRVTHGGVSYSRSFNISMIVVSLVTSLIIMSIMSNIALSLGMVGALTIVRFRTAIKDPMDIAFMFWAIGVGIATGAGFYSTAIVGSLIIGAVLLAFTKIRLSEPAHYLLVVNHDVRSSPAVQRKLQSLARHRIKSRTITSAGVELTMEVRISGSGEKIVDEMSAVEGVTNVSLIDYPRDYAL